MSAENTEEVEAQTGRKMDTTLENLKRELGGIHAGRVESFDAGFGEGRLLWKSQPYLAGCQYFYSGTPDFGDQSLGEKDDQGYRAFPPGGEPWIQYFKRRQSHPLDHASFTEERRKEYVKQVKKIGEDAKIAVRNVRREGNDLLKKLEKEKAISQDEEKASNKYSAGNRRTHSYH